MTWEIREGDVLDRLREMPDESVHCVVTSPPYYRLRDYGTAGQIGLEPTPAAYLARMVEVFQQVRRVLRCDGTCWVNMGDGYAGGGRGGNPEDSAFRKQATNVGSLVAPSPVPDGLKPKDLIGMPWRLAFALQDDGWWLRSEIIWAKPNPMPESVTDRPTKAHEQIFLLTKSARYFYDADAIREPHQDKSHPVENGRFVNPRAAGGVNRDGYEPHTQGWNGTGTKLTHREYNPAGRNARSVWTIATQPFSEAHFATFPEELPRRCILAGTSERGVCPECGAPWKRVVERESYGKAFSATKFDNTHQGGPLSGSRQAYRAAGMEGPPAPVTLGWEPTCTHGGEPVPATVLDIFAGSGTTIMVALQLGRSGLGIELNPEYAAMARRRIVADAPLFNAPVLPLEAAR